MRRLISPAGTSETGRQFFRYIDFDEFIPRAPLLRVAASIRFEAPSHSRSHVIEPPRAVISQRHFKWFLESDIKGFVSVPHDKEGNKSRAR